MRLRKLCPACLLKRGLESQTAGGDASRPDSAGYTPPTPAELTPLFPDLEILELVGRGGMGVVYKARQKRLDRLVALKILSPSVGKDPAFADRFAREARAMAMLSHPHIVAVYDFGQTISPLPPGTSRGGGEANSPLPPGEGQGERVVGSGGGLYYFLMEYIDGLNLRQLLDSGKLAPKEALAIVPQICEALQYAHDKGVVHRDIKPENVLLDKGGQVKIADFGLAKLMGREAKDFTLTGVGQVMGTPNYMAPEQIEHPQDVDHRADIYSLGVVFYQMLTGELPIGRFAPPSRKVQIDVRLDEVVLRALEKEPERRYQQASELGTEVQSIVTAPAAANAAATIPVPWYTLREYRSKATLFGWPLVHVTRGFDPATGRPKTARGWVAVSDRTAVGLLAMAGQAYGGIAFGGIAMGAVAMGGIGFGVIQRIGHQRCLAAGVWRLKRVLPVRLRRPGDCAAGLWRVGAGLCTALRRVGPRSTLLRQQCAGPGSRSVCCALYKRRAVDIRLLRPARPAVPGPCHRHDRCRQAPGRQRGRRPAERCRG